MKKQSLLILSLLLLASCNGGGTNSSSSSSDGSESTTSEESSASTSSSEESTSESSISEEPSSSEETSSSESSSEESSSESSEESSSESSDTSSEEEKEAITGYISFSEGASIDGPAVTTITEGGAAVHATLTLENLPTGKTIEDCTITWPNTNAQVAYSEIIVDAEGTKLNDAHRFFTPVICGDIDIEVEVTCGDVTSTITQTVHVNRDDSRYTKIGTAEDFINKVIKSSAGTDRFILTSNIDLGGVDTYALSDETAAFNGVLDGDGYKVSNFNADPNSNGDGGGLWKNVAGYVRNVHFVGSHNQTKGMGGLLGRTITGAIENCLFEVIVNVDTSVEGYDWTWQRSGLVGGWLQGRIEDCVLINETENAQSLATCAYVTANEEGLAAIDPKVYNIYTPTSDLSLVTPFQPEGKDQYLAKTRDIHTGVVWEDMLASDYDLDSDVWILSDGEKPRLTHSDEVLLPEVSISLDDASLELDKDTGTLTYTLSNFESEPTLELLIGDSTIVSATEGTSSWSITPLAIGSTTLQVKATLGEEEYLSNEVTVTVVEQGSSSSDDPVITDAIEIASKADFEKYFNVANGATYTTSNFSLTADIDLEGTYIGDLLMAGEYSGTFLGNGHTISNFTAQRSFFNIISSEGKVQDLTIICDDYTGSGFGVLAFQSKGTITNVDVTVTIDTVAINTFGPVALSGEGTFVDCDTTITLNQNSNTLYAIAREDGGTFTNCTYYIDGSAPSDILASAIISPTSSGIVLRDSK